MTAARITIFGVGPILIGIGLLLAGICLAGQYLLHIQLSLPAAAAPVRVGTGILLAAIALFLWLAAAIRIVRGFPAGRLLTTGVYSICRNPMYAAFIVFLIPGIALLCNNLLLLLVSVVEWLIFKRLIRREESYLAQTFGSDYAAYAARVPQLIPFIHV